jgi:hypothetical protein
VVRFSSLSSDSAWQRERYTLGISLIGRRQRPRTRPFRPDTQRYPTVHLPSLSTKLVQPLRIIARIGHQRLRTHPPQSIRHGQRFDDAPIGLSQVGFRALAANNKEVFASRPATEARTPAGFCQSHGGVHFRHHAGQQLGWELVRAFRVRIRGQHLLG